MPSVPARRLSQNWPTSRAPGTGPARPTPATSLLLMPLLAPVLRPVPVAACRATCRPAPLGTGEALVDRAPGRGPAGAGKRRGEPPYRRVLEHEDQRELLPERALQLPVAADHLDRVGAQVEEVRFYTDRRRAQHPAQYVGDGPLQWIPWRRRRGFGRRHRQ